MNKEQYIEACKDYYGSTASKLLDDGVTVIYSILPKKGIRLHPQGYWKSEIEALESFYNYLTNNNRI